MQEETNKAPKKVLLISYFFPPRENIGSARPGGIAKYLHQFGWEVDVLTAKLPDGPRLPLKIVETDYRDLVALTKKFLGVPQNRSLGESPDSGGYLPGLWGRLLRPFVRAMRSAILYPDAMRGWIPFALAEGRRLLRENRFDALLVSCGPESGALVAQRLASEFGVPFVAEFEDLWTQSQIERGGKLRRFFERSLERRTLLPSAALTTVSEGYAKILRSDYPHHRVEVITTGTDQDDTPDPPPRPSPKFKLLYPGRFYPDHQNPEILFLALRDFLRETPGADADLRVDFYGATSRFLLPLVHQFGLEGIVSTRDPVPWAQSLKLQREAQILLLLGWNGPRAEGWLPGKIFEFLGARRPILLAGGPKADSAALLERAGAGVYVPDAAGLKGYLREAYGQFKRLGVVPYAGRREVLDSLTQFHMAKKFASLLDDVVANSKNRGSVRRS